MSGTPTMSNRLQEEAKVVVHFWDGLSRVYTLVSDGGKASLLSGGTAIIKFKHPNFGEFMECEIEPQKKETAS